MDLTVPGQHTQPSLHRCTAELFTWASGRSISRKEAMRCARRDPGRSWEAIYSEMDKLGAARADCMTVLQSNCAKPAACAVPRDWEEHRTHRLEQWLLTHRRQHIRHG